MRSPLTPSAADATNPSTGMTATLTATTTSATVPPTSTATTTATGTAIPCSAGSHDCLGACVANASVTTCGTPCLACPTPVNGKATCDGAACGIACDSGYHDCGGACVPNTSVSSCGASCVPCPGSPGKLATCNGTICGLECDVDCPDQLAESCIAGQTMGAVINEACRFVGQTYTAGSAGTLTGVAVSVLAIKTQFQLRVSLRDAQDGFPGATILASTTLDTSDSPLANVIRFSAPVEQVAGQQYAIVVDYPAAPPVGAGQMQGVWAGVTSDCHPGGYDVCSEDGTRWRTNGDDLFFEVFIKGN